MWILEGLPHARGGVSSLRPRSGSVPASSPRTWGCFPLPNAFDIPQKVFPTHVGVFLTSSNMPFASVCLPHARGGVSSFCRRSTTGPMSSPRTWGCFHGEPATHENMGVFPTHVGVFPVPGPLHSRQACLPHARGGVSAVKSNSHTCPRSSPRTWGCFWHGLLTDSSEQVFPTHVGVFPSED